MNVYEKIAAQQKGKENTDVWMVGEQLKGILRADPTLEEIVAQDLDVKEMGLAFCAKKIKAKADEIHKHVKGNCVCITPDVAEGIIREFYGLPSGDPAPAPAPAAQSVVGMAPDQDGVDSLDFADFL